MKSRAFVPEKLDVAALAHDAASLAGEWPAASLERLAWHEQAKTFAMIGISTDDYRDRALAVLKRTNATISHFIDFRLELEHLLGASSIPLTVLVDARGRVLEKVVGAKAWDGPEALRFVGQTFGNAALMKAR